MKNVSIDAVCAATGLGKRQVLRLTREGRIPAQIVGRTFVMTDLQLEQLRRDGIAPSRTARAEHPLMPSDFIRRKAS